MLPSTVARPAPGVALLPVARRLWESLGPALLAAGLALVVALAGWRGVDVAAATYRIDEFRAHGLVIWDTAWYGGNYPLGYSVLFPPLGALIGLPLIGILGAAVCAGCFDQLVRVHWGRRPFGSWFFAVATVLEVGIGQFPFLTAEAFGLAALVALSRRRTALALAAGVATALCSGVAVLFLALAVVAWAWVERDRWRPLVAAAVLPVVVLGACNLVFPGTGSFPYPTPGMLMSLLTAAIFLLPPLRAAPALRAGAVLYAAGTLSAWAISSPMGGNANRLAQQVGIPLVVCLLTSRDGRAIPRRWTVAVSLALVPLVVWQWSPGINVAKGVSRAPATTAAFYRPLLGALAVRGPEPVRIEVVPTKQHWESAYVAPHDVLARGWERQLDIANNPIFYRPGAISPAAYRQWLTTNGVSYVALPNAPLDYAGKAEGRLLGATGGVPGLTLVWHSADWRLWKVDGAAGLVSGPGRLTQVQPDAVTVTAAAPGAITVRVRWTSYWSVTTGKACVKRAPGDWTQVDATHPGVIHLGTTLDPLGGGSGHCPSPTRRLSGQPPGGTFSRRGPAPR